MTDTDHGSALVTVVFVDIEDSTALVERLGDEAGTALLRAQLDAVLERIEPYGGREVKSLGDGLMLAFLHPVWRWGSRWRPSGPWPVRRLEYGSGSTPARSCRGQDR